MSTLGFYLFFFFSFVFSKDVRYSWESFLIHYSPISKPYLVFLLNIMKGVYFNICNFFITSLDDLLNIEILQDLLRTSIVDNIPLLSPVSLHASAHTSKCILTTVL